MIKCVLRAASLLYGNIPKIAEKNTSSSRWQPEDIIGTNKEQIEKNAQK